jgi:hypothetical protein
MNSTDLHFHSIGPTGQAMPLALIYSSQLLLTEKASPSGEALSASVRTESHTIRATLVTPILREIRGYRHGGLNE